jgi:hypothetical protein
MKQTLIELLKQLKELYSKEAESKIRLEGIQKDIGDIESKILSYGILDEPLPIKPLSAEDVILKSQLRNQINFPKWTLEKKAIHIFNDAQFCLSNREVVDRICELESRAGDLAYSKSLMGKVADAMVRRWKAKKVFGRYVEDNVIYHGLIEWFDQGGSVKDQYRKDR